MKVIQSIERAMVRLVLHHPFFASIVLRQPLVSDESISTACTDGLRIHYNPAFLATLDVQEISAVLAHEVLHIAFGHAFRQGRRDRKKWNYACDYAVNLILADNKFRLPSGVLMDERFRGMSAEKIYALLPAEEMLPHGVMLGEVQSSKVGREERDRIISNVAKNVAEAMHEAKIKHRVPLGMDRVVQTLSVAMMDWREILTAFLTECMRDDYTFAHPNRNYIHTGFYLPALKGQGTGRFLLAVDTSGSQENKQLQVIATHIMSILRLASEPLTVLYCDAAIAGVEEIDPESPPKKLGFKGGGGTDFKPVAEWIEVNQFHPEVLLYFTDGCCNSFPPKPDYPVLWITDNPTMKAPYGEIIVIMDDTLEA